MIGELSYPCCHTNLKGFHAFVNLPFINLLRFERGSFQSLDSYTFPVVSSFIFLAERSVEEILLITDQKWALA